MSSGPYGSIFTHKVISWVFKILAPKNSQLMLNHLQMALSHWNECRFTYFHQLLSTHNPSLLINYNLKPVIWISNVKLVGVGGATPCVSTTLSPPTSPSPPTLNHPPHHYPLCPTTTTTPPLSTQPHHHHPTTTTYPTLGYFSD